MKKVLSFTVLVVLVLSGLSYGFARTSADREVEAVKEAVVQGYIEGVFHKTDPALVEKYWHPDCDIYQYRAGKVVKIPALSHFGEAMKTIKAPYDPSVTYAFLDVHVKEYAAVAIVEIQSHGVYRYTDFISLYKLADGWKIATKIYHRPE